MGQRVDDLMGWVDARFPLTKMWEEHLSKYYAPKNFNFWYYFGSLAIMVLVIQVLSGIFLAMFYKPDTALAFQSVEMNIMRDVDWGWLIRYLHSTGASAFFIVVYLHMFRGLIYGSYKKPRELVWIFGVLIFLALMAEGFMGYLLPWGQMSFWGAQVIINLVSAIPFVGDDLGIWVRGDFVIGDATLNRFFSLHIVAIPLILIGLIEGFSFYLIINAFGFKVPILLAIFVFSLSSLIGVVSLLPGGLGATEASMIGLLLSYISLSVASASTFIIRGLTLWYSVFVGFLAYLLLEKKKKK